MATTHQTHHYVAAPVSSRSIVLGLALALLAATVAYGAYAWLRRSSAPFLGVAPTATTTVATPTTPGITTPTPRVATPRPPAQQKGGRPLVITLAAEGISQSGALLRGHVNPNRGSTSYWFEYGPTTDLGARTEPTSIGSGTGSVVALRYISGLAPDTTYYYNLAAQNNFGITRGTVSRFTTLSLPLPPMTLPVVVTARATNIATSTATLRGTVNPNGLPAWNWFSYGPNDSISNNTPLVFVGSGGAETAVTSALSGLQPSTTYSFRVNVQNQFGTVPGATFSFTTLLNPPPPPPPVRAPAVSTRPAINVTAASATLRGTVNPSGATTTYWFEYGAAFAPELDIETAPIVLGPGQLALGVNATISGLSPSTTYAFRLVAENAPGKVKGETQRFTTR